MRVIDLAAERQRRAKTEAEKLEAEARQRAIDSLLKQSKKLNWEKPE